MNQTFGKIKQAIQDANNIAIFCHVDPDIDCLSSMYGLAFGLESIRKKVTMFTHENLSDYQKALLNEKLVKIGGFNPKKFDLLISVDTPEASRLGIYGQDFVVFENTIKIDHHPEKEEMGKLRYVDTESSSCAEIVSSLLSYLGIQITSEMATILYAGLSADTNSYTNSNVTAKTLENGMKLIKCGADINKVNNVNVRMQSLVRLKATKVFYRNFQLVSKQIAISTMSHRQLLAAGALKRDTDGFSNQLLNYIGVNIACMIVEREPHSFSLSFRSMPGYDVSIIASRLNGGGHKGASGGQIVAEDIHEAKKIVLREIRKYLKERKANETR